MADKTRVLFLCSRNRCRSQMAEALVNNDLGDRFEAVSAGTNIAQDVAHPLAIRALGELGIDHAGAKAKHLDVFAHETFDHVISLCDDADKECPTFFGAVRRTHIGFENPDASTGTDDERMVVFRRVRDQIRERIETYLFKALNQKKGVVPVRPDDA